DSSGIFYTDSLPYDGKMYRHRYPNPVTAANATYTIRLIASSGKTCESESDQSVTVQPSPHLQFDPVPAVCNYTSGPVQITEASELTGLPGALAYFGKGVTQAGLLQPWLAGPGTDVLLCVYDATNGCVDSAYQTVFIEAPPKVNAGTDTMVVIGQPLQLRASIVANGAYTVQWSPSTGLSDPDIADPVATFSAAPDSIRYLVTVTDTAGCKAVASIKVEVFKTLRSEEHTSEL